jgi:hypothetical protein
MGQGCNEEVDAAEVACLNVLCQFNLEIIIEAPFLLTIASDRVEVFSVESREVHL